MKKKLMVLFITIISLATTKVIANTWTGVSSSGKFIVPESLARFCEFEQKKLSENPDDHSFDQTEIYYLSDQIECINKIISLKEDVSAEVKLQAQELGEQILRESINISISEGLGQKVYAFNYPSEVIENLADNLSKASNNKELLSAIMIVEKEDAKLQNELLMLKSTEMQFNSLSKIKSSRGGY